MYNFLGKKENHHNSRSENNQALNIILITQGISPIVIPIVESTHNVIGIIESAPRVEPKPFKKWLFNRLRAIYSLITKSQATGTLSKYAYKLAIPYFYMTKHNNAALEKWVKELEPDMMVVYSMSQLLKENIFSMPKYGTINLHPSLLPKYRGPNPWFWTYYYQEKQGGVTVHYIDKGEDTGDIIYQESYDIPLGAKFRQLQNLAINKIGTKLLLTAINAIATGTAPRYKQPKQSPTSRGRNISNNEHDQMIDWENWDIKRIWHLMRGTELWFNCIEQPKGLYKGRRWLIGEFEKCNMQNTYQVGNIYKERSQYFVACRDGKILLSIKFGVKNFIFNFFR